ncbi:MAG: hypothetical protein EA421_11090 [Gemmatimonadales bacterium]|nr:MAG: hypothetical protein EA421_11090 [Gemmatimonadales bacterium]
MTRFLSFVFALALVAGGAPGLSAQFFTGTSPMASDPFPLQAGLVVVELEHEGTGQFRARLLDQSGAVVEELAGTTGAFTGSRAVQIPRADQYLLDVVADGEWQVRIRRFGEVADDELDAHPELERARTLGREVANDQGVLGSFGGGFLAGAVAGPVGSVVATVWVGRDPPPLPVRPLVQRGPFSTRSSRRVTTRPTGCGDSGRRYEAASWGPRCSPSPSSGTRISLAQGDCQATALPRISSAFPSFGFSSDDLTHRVFRRLLKK